MQPKGSPGALVPARARRGTRTRKWCTNCCSRAAALPQTGEKTGRRRLADASGPYAGMGRPPYRQPSAKDLQKIVNSTDDFVIGCRGTGAEALAAMRRMMGRPTAMADLPHRARPRPPTGQKIFKVRGLDSPIAQAVVLGHSRTGMLGIGTRHGLPCQALRRCAPTERLRTRSRPHISFHISSVACRFSERTPRLGATVCRHGGKPPI